MVKAQLYRASAISLLGLACFALAGCDAETQPRTELMLVADTDIDRIDSIAFEVRGPGGERKSASGAVDAAHPGPRVLGLVRDKGSLGPLTISASGYAQNELLLTRTAVVSFVPGKTLVVALHLVESCIDPACDSGETCTELGCRPQQLEPSELESWTGQPPKLDGNGSLDGGNTADASLDSGAKDAAAEEDGGAGDAGEGLLACADAGEVMTSSDPEHCGDCETVCQFAPNKDAVAPICTAGECGLTCETLRGDCDGLWENGCEQALDDNAFCGGCVNSRCKGNERCDEGTCVRK